MVIGKIKTFVYWKNIDVIKFNNKMELKGWKPYINVSLMLIHLFENLNQQNPTTKRENWPHKATLHVSFLLANVHEETQIKPLNTTQWVFKCLRALGHACLLNGCPFHLPCVLGHFLCSSFSRSIQTRHQCRTRIVACRH